MTADPQVLHTRLLAWLDEWERDVPQPEPMLAAMRAVVELHQIGLCGFSRCRRPAHVCVACGPADDYPCATVKVIASALGVEP